MVDSQGVTCIHFTCVNCGRKYVHVLCKSAGGYKKTFIAIDYEIYNKRKSVQVDDNV